MSTAVWTWHAPTDWALHGLASQPRLTHTALVAFPLLDFQGQVQGPDGKVDRLGIHASHLVRDMGCKERCSPLGF